MPTKLLKNQQNTNWEKRDEIRLSKTVVLDNWPCRDFKMIKMISKTKYLVSYWALAHPVNISSRGV